MITGTLLLAVVVCHVGWCEWSLPRFGVVTSHGLETTACNWGTTILSAMVGALALTTLVTGLVAFWLRSRSAGWWLAHVPVIVCWGGLILSLVFSVWP